MLVLPTTLFGSQHPLADGSGDIHEIEFIVTDRYSAKTVKA